MGGKGGKREVTLDGGVGEEGDGLTRRMFCKSEDLVRGRKQSRVSRTCETTPYKRRYLHF